MEERVYQGHIYRRAGPGEPWQMAGPAPKQSGGGWITDPYKESNDRRADQDQGFESERLRIAREAERRQREQAEMDARLKAEDERRKQAEFDERNKPNVPAGYMLGPDGKSAMRIPGVALPADEKKDESAGEMGRVNALVRQINEVQRLFSSGPGKTRGLAGIRDYLPGQSSAEFDKAAASLEDIAVSAFKVPGMGSQSDADAARIAAALKPSRWDFDAGSARQLTDARSRVDEWFKARGLPAPTWEGAPKLSPIAEEQRAFTVNDVADFAGGLTGGQFDFDPQGNLTRDGKPVEVAAEVANSAQYREAYRQRFGEMPPVAVDIVGGQVTPEARDALEQKRDTFLGGVDATVRGAADTATFGIADPLSALVRTAFNDDGFGANLARERAISSADEEVNFWPRLGGQMAGAVPSMLAAGRLGAATMPSRPLLGTAVADTGAGAVYGGVSNAETDPVMGALTGGALALAGNQIGQRLISPAIEGAIARSAGNTDPVVRALSRMDDSVDLNKVTGTLEDARRLGVPMGLADADPRLRTLAGSAVRLSPNARTLAEDVIAPRGRGQAERAVAAIERDFGPTVNIDETGDALINRGREAAGPLYERAYAAPVVSTPEMTAILATPAGRQALARARTIAANERRDPSAMGFALDANGDVVLNPVRVDLYGAQAQAKAGFDEAQTAHRAAMRTQGGNTVVTRDALADARDAMRAADDALSTAPSSGSAAESRGYTTQTLDYVKRGLDDILEEKRDKVTRRLVLDEAGRAINDVRASLVQEVDRLNPTYRTARRAYEGPARERDALMAGRGAVGVQTNPDKLERMTSGLLPEQMGQFQSGYRSAMGEQVERMRYSANPFDAIYGSPDQGAKAAALFPDGAPNFARQAELERDLARTQYETLGGSPTAARSAADQQLAPGLGVQLAGETALGMLTGAPPIGALTSAARATMGDRWRMGFGGSKQADAVAKYLLDTDPEQALSGVEAVIARQLMRKSAETIGASAGGVLALPFLASQ